MDESAAQESVVSNRSSAGDGEVHHVALVVTSQRIEFWMDGSKMWEGSIPRPVTDCPGAALEVGSSNVPLLGDIIFYPRRLQEMDMKEIIFAGFTLEAIAQGKIPMAPSIQPTDLMMSRSDSKFAEAADGRALAARQLEIEASLSRAAIDLAVNSANLTEDARISVQSKDGCSVIPVFGNSTSCRIIESWDPAETDPVTRQAFYNLLPSSVRPPNAGARDRLVYDHTRPNDYLRYSPEAWPSFCGQSASFSLWLETATRGALVSRYSAAEEGGHSTLQYALYAESYGLLVKGARAPSSSYLPGSYGQPLDQMDYMSRRHLAFVFDADKDETRTYLDGALLGATRHVPGTIARLDCNLTGDTAYTGLGHLAPGVWGIRGPLQARQLVLSRCAVIASPAAHACRTLAFVHVDGIWRSALIELFYRTGDTTGARR